jgi:hypothetical protein
MDEIIDIIRLADDDDVTKASTVAGVSGASTAATEASFAMEREAWRCADWPSSCRIGEVKSKRRGERLRREEIETRSVT